MPLVNGVLSSGNEIMKRFGNSLHTSVQILQLRGKTEWLPQARKMKPLDLARNCFKPGNVGFRPQVNTICPYTV